MDANDGNDYIYVRHYENGTVSRILKPRCYQERVDAHDTVIPGQQWAAFIFEPSLRAKPDPDAVYGLIQMVGCFPNEAECTAFVRARVLGASRRDEYLLAPCGAFCPLSTAPAALGNVELVDLEQKLHADYSEAQEARHQKEVDEVTQRQERLKKEEEDAVSDRRRETTLQRAEKGDDLESYVRLRVARASALAAAHRMQKQLDRIAEMRRKMAERAAHFEDVLRARDVDHPNYAADYQQVYIDTLVKACTMVRDADDEADYNHLAYPEEPPVRFEAVVNPSVKERYKKQSHEYDDDQPTPPAL